MTTEYTVHLATRLRCEDGVAPEWDAVAASLLHTLVGQALDVPNYAAGVRTGGTARVRVESVEVDEAD